jgi:hypothetical protein
MNDVERLQADYRGTELTTGPHPMALVRERFPDLWRASDLERRCQWAAHSNRRRRDLPSAPGYGERLCLHQSRKMKPVSPTPSWNPTFSNGIA